MSTVPAHKLIAKTSAILYILLGPICSRDSVQFQLTAVGSGGELECRDWDCIPVQRFRCRSSHLHHISVKEKRSLSKCG